MRNDPMEQKLKTAAEHLTPDVLDRILRRLCQGTERRDPVYGEYIRSPQPQQ